MDDVELEPSNFSLEIKSGLIPYTESASTYLKGNTFSLLTALSISTAYSGLVRKTASAGNKDLHVAIVDFYDGFAALSGAADRVLASNIMLKI